MNILSQLSSQQGDKTEKSNKTVAGLCKNSRELIADIASGFESKDKKLQSDCIEVFTMVAETHPQLIVPYAIQVLPLLANKETRTRWEAVHTLAYIAEKVPDIILSVLPELQEIIEKDKSIIVRDYATDVVANYAKASIEASEKAFGILKAVLNQWDERHAKQVFIGFSNILDNIPGYSQEILRLVTPYQDAKKKVIVNEAKKLIKRTEK
jgi:hypothetical protein